MPAGHVLTYASPTAKSYTSATTTLASPFVMMAVPVEGYNFAVSTTSSATISSASSSITSTLATRSTGLSSAARTTATNAPSGPASAAASGLSTGAKAGIGGGVAGVALLGFAALAAFLISRRKRRDRYKVSPSPLGKDIGSKEKKYIGDIVEVHEDTASWEVDGASSRAEVHEDTASRRWEVNGASSRAELQG